MRLFFSVTGHFHVSFMKDVTVYSATKFSVTSITESLRELMCQQNLPIRVTVINYIFYNNLVLIVVRLNIFAFYK